MNDFFSTIQERLQNSKVLEFRFDYDVQADTLSAKGYSSDGVKRVNILVQSPDAPEFDISFGSCINYYASLGGQSAGVDYILKLIDDLQILDKYHWQVTVAMLVFSSKVYIAPSLDLKVLKSPPRLFLYSYHNRELGMDLDS